MENHKFRIILSSVFFVLGFSIIFSVLGVLLQSILVSYAFWLREILNLVAGLVIIFFGLVMTGLLKIGFLQKEHKLHVQKSKHQYVSSFLFGGAFAVGWTPCVGAILGAVLTLAVTNPAVAFPMMIAYSIGLGIPFIIAAIFISNATGVIEKMVPHLEKLNLFFGLVIVLLGILILTNNLSVIFSFFQFDSLIFDFEASTGFTEPNILIAFIAGVVSFLSPCVLPIVPAYLTFIAGTSVNEFKNK